MRNVLEFIKIAIGYPLAVGVTIFVIISLNGWMKVEERGKMHAPLFGLNVAIGGIVGYLVLVLFGIDRYI